MARPRSTSLPPDDMIALGEEMVSWVKKNKPWRLSEWYCQQKHILYQHWRVWRERPEFAPYYEEAIDLIGRNYIDGTIDKSIAQRFLRIYFKELKDEEDEMARYHSELRQKEAVQVSADDIARAQRILEQVSRNQVSARNIEDNKIKAADKS